MKILFLTSRVPYPPIGGIQLRVFHFIKALSRQHEITLLSLSEQPVPAEQMAGLQPYVRRLEIIELSKSRSYLNCLAGLFSSKPLQVYYYRSPALFERLQEIARHEKFDLIYVHLIRMAEYTKALNGEPKILDLTDAMSLSYERICQIHRDHSLKLFHVAQKVECGRLREYEAAAVRRFDRNLIISQTDKKFLGQFADVSRMKIIGPGVNLNYFSFYDGDFDANRIVFLGTMSFLPNKDAIIYFYKKIWPNVKRRIPAMKLSIVGANPAPEVVRLSRDADIEVTGYVPDVRPFLRRAAVSICPMRVGAGAKNKVLEAMSIGTPVVSTSLGAEGIEAQPGHHLLVADAPKLFANQVSRIAQRPELRSRLARQARHLIEEKYDWDLVTQPLERLIESMASKKKPAHEPTRNPALIAAG